MKRIILFALVVLLGQPVFSQPPSWSVTPSNFQFTATVTGILIVNDTITNAADNILGAFVNGQVRGVASPTNVGGTHIYFLTLYSNVAAGDTVSFQAYLAVEDSIYDVAETIEFVSSGTNGDPVNPQELHLNENNAPYFNATVFESVLSNQQFTALYLPDYVNNSADTGITFSLANIGGNLNASVSDDTLYVTHNGSIMIDSLRVNLLDSANTSVQYDDQYFVYEVTGINTPISFDPIPDVLLGNNSDLCIDLSTFLNNVDNDAINWSILGVPQDTIGAVSVSWSVTPASFQYSMNIVSHGHINGLGVDGSNYQLGAFDGNNNLVGVGYPQLVAGDWLTFLTIYSNVNSGDVTLQLFDTINDVLYQEKTDTIAFVSGGVEGSISNPVQHYYGNYYFTLNNSMLCVGLFDTIDVVLDSITISATEALTGAMYSVTTTVLISYFNENQPYLTGILDQQILPSMSFTTFDLDNYLTEIDGDSVVYSVIDTNNITITIDNQNVVTITPNNPTWRGADTVIFYAVDFTTNQLYDTDTVIYSVVNGIDLSGIPDQSISLLEAFAPVPLNDYLTHFYVDPVNWYSSSDELIHIVNNDTLYTYLPYSGWAGSDTIIVMVENAVLTNIFDTDTVIYTVVAPNGMSELTDNKIAIYPNPNNGEFVIDLGATINADDVTVKIFNAFGQLVGNYYINSSNQRLDVDLKTGVYWVNVSSGNVRHIKQLIIH
ncbi:MAG: T9SS type A sorting domain-containing protein [Flavobacteriales bacterium]|nr:T9SS type A sorting domain-containing protein [Flavobacteriales bacterium]